MGMAQRDDMIRQLQERFSGHEVPVDPGTWTAISGQLAASAAATGAVDQLFRDRFTSHEADVDPGVWDAISGQLGHGAAAGGAGASGWGTVAGWAAAGIVAVVMVGGAVLWSQQENEPSTTTIGQTNEVPASGREEVATVNVPSATQGRVDEDPAMEITSAPVPAASVPFEATGGSTRTAPGEEVAKENGPPQPIASGGPVDGTPGDVEQGREVVVAIQEEMVAEADEEVMKPATVPDPLLEEEGPQQAPPNIGFDQPSALDVVDQTTFQLFLPNVFTPGSDGINDNYLPVGEGIVEARIRVYAVSNGELVFSADDLRAWDGTFFNSGQACPEGHYLYAIEVAGTDGRVHSQGQTVRLFR